jgi:hypothetical protein
MQEAAEKPSALKLFPVNRFDPDFPRALWFAGLWLYLKSFLCLCYLYMIGVEPTPYTTEIKVEIVYFAVAFIPALLLGLALWNRKRSAVKFAFVFFIIDTPLMLFHVLRLSQAGLLEAGLTGWLEYSAVILNVVALGWLVKYVSEPSHVKA